MKKGIIISIFIILVIAVISIYNLCFYHIKYNDNMTPNTIYNISLNKINKKLVVITRSNCSTINCNNKEKKYSVTLTKQEYDKIIKIINKIDKDILCDIFETISRDNEKFETNGTTYREYGNKWLDDLIKENY